MEARIVGYLVALLAVASFGRTVRSATSESAHDRDQTATEAPQIVDDGANTTTTTTTTTAATATAVTAGIVEKVAAYSAPTTFVSHSGDVSGHGELGRTLFASAVVFSGLTLAAAFVWLVAPLFGYKFCAIAGTCGTGAASGVGVGNGNGNGNGVGNGEDSVIVNGGEEASVLFPFSLGYRRSTPYGGYRKRSLNYVGPILRTLSSAYEKFEEYQSSTTPKAD